MKKYIIFLPIMLIMTIAASCSDFINDMAMESTLNEGLVAYWPVTSADSTSVQDFSGNNLNLTWSVTPIFTDGKFSRALDFNNTNFLNNTNSVFNSIKDAVTLTAWVRKSAENNMHFLEIDGQGFYFSQNSSGTIQFCATNTSGTSRTVSAIVPLNQWVFIVGTYDGTNVKLYIDGTLKNQDVLTGQMDPGKLVIAQQSSAPHWTGALDEIRIYNRALSQDEIKMLMDIGRD
jgi:hypothetical protein